MPLTDEKFLTIGAHMARKLFDKRSRKGTRNAEVHLSEVEVAAMCALAAEQGAKAAQGKLVVRLPKGGGRQLPSMTSIHCGPPRAPPRVEQDPLPHANSPLYQGLHQLDQKAPR